MFKSVVRTCVLSAVFLLPLPSHAAPTDSVAIVNGETITRQDYKNYAKARAEQTRANVTPDVLLEELIQRELLKQDALKNGLDKRPEFIQKLEYIRNSLLMAMGTHDYLSKHPLDDATLKREYDKQVAKLKVPKEYKVRHILVKTETEAKAIIAELDKGKAFSKLANKKSRDTPSAKKGGRLGWMTQSKLISNFGTATAVKKLGKGKYTTNPVKSRFGWHLIQLDNIRTAALPPFKSVKDRIRAALQLQQMQTYVDELKKQAKIQISVTLSPKKE